MKKFHLGVLAFTLLALGMLMGYASVRSGLYPIARVNGSVLLYRNVEENIFVLERLYESGLVSNAEVKEMLGEGNASVFKNVLEGLVLNHIIKTSASSEVHNAALDRINDYLRTQESRLVESSIAELYGWDKEEFRERILEPQALEEVAAEMHGDNYASWLKEIKSNATVSLWFVPYEWNGQRLVDK